MRQQPDGLPVAQRRWAMFCVLLALALSSLDSAIANIALPSIVRALATSDAAAVWVVNGYQLAVTICLLPAAALGESLGLRRVYAAGLAIFTLASLGCALSPTLAVLVAARLAQGVGGACMSVASVALVRAIYPRSIIARGYALVALAVAGSGALGPTIAALILAVASWPWLFLVNVPLGLIALPLALTVTPPDVRVPRRFDWIGSGINALAFGLVIVGLRMLGSGGTAVAVEVMVAGMFCFALLARQQSRKATPLLPFDLLRIPAFALCDGHVDLFIIAAQILAYVSLPFLFETAAASVARFETGLLVTPWPVMVAFAAPVGARLMGRYPAAVICSVGLILLAGGLLLTAGAAWQRRLRLDIAWRPGDLRHRPSACFRRPTTPP